MDTIRRKCLCCGEFFDISEKEQIWYNDKNYSLPKRCGPCRKSRREMNKEVNDGEKKK